MLDNPVTGWDRYAYVRNNPLNYTDPGGNFATPEPDKKLCPDGVCEDLGTQPKRGAPDELDEDLLTDRRAQQLYALYIEMWALKEGWWWDVYGAGGFTIWEFMAVIWGYEQQKYPNSRNLSKAMANHAADWCHDENRRDHTTAEGALSFMASYSESAWRRIRGYFTDQKSITEVFDKPSSSYSGGMHIVQAIRNRASVDDIPLRLGNLYDVGNISLSNKVLLKMIRLGMVYDYWGKVNTFVVLTYCQSNFYQAALKNRGIEYVTHRNYDCGG